MVYISPHSEEAYQPIGKRFVQGSLTDNLHSKFWPVIRPCRHILDHANYTHTLNYASEDDMLAVKEVALFCGDEELDRLCETNSSVSWGERTWQPFVFGPELAC